MKYIFIKFSGLGLPITYKLQQAGLEDEYLSLNYDLERGLYHLPFNVKVGNLS